MVWKITESVKRIENSDQKFSVNSSGQFLLIKPGVLYPSRAVFLDKTIPGWKFLVWHLALRKFFSFIYWICTGFIKKIMICLVAGNRRDDRKVLIGKFCGRSFGVFLDEAPGECRISSLSGSQALRFPQGQKLLSKTALMGRARFPRALHRKLLAAAP